MVLAGNLCHWKMSSKFVLPCLWAPVQKSTECAVFYKLLQQHRKAGGWTQHEEKINATIYLEQPATHQESSHTKAGTTSGYPGSSTAPEGLDLYGNLQNNSAAEEKGRGTAHPPALPGLQLHRFTSHKPHFCCQVFIQLSAFDIVNQVCQELCNS